MVNCWFGARWFGFPASPLWKGLLLRGIPRIPNHRAPNHQLTISWSSMQGGPLRSSYTWGVVKPLQRPTINSFACGEINLVRDLEKLFYPFYNRFWGPTCMNIHPLGSMYGIFTYIWLNFMVNVGKYKRHTWHKHPMGMTFAQLK